MFHKYETHLFFTIILVFLLTTGCASGEYEVGRTPTKEATFGIDARFKPLQEKLGVLVGEGISPAFLYNQVYYQYTQSVLLIYEPEAAARDRYRLYPLAYEWVRNDPPVADPSNAQKIYANGHIIWDEVVPYYINMGADVTGMPLTEVYFNAEKGRYEQIFENMGFYRNQDDARGKMFLMPFGQWKCGGDCKFSKIEENTLKNSPPVSDGQFGEAAARFLDVVARQGSAFTGRPIAEVELAEDGYLQQVFENVIMLWNPDRPDEMVVLRRLPQLVGIQPETPVPQSHGAGMYFHESVGDLGYNIAQPFMEYITTHGTLEFSGDPITEMHSIGGGITRQCFEKFCLIYDPTAPDSLRIRPENLGDAYWRSHPNQPIPTALENEAPPLRNLSKMKLSIWEEFPLLDPKSSQVIGAAIYDDVTPLSGVQFNVTVYVPDENRPTYTLPLTGEDGQAYILLDPISAPKGTIIPYEVCVMNLASQPVCMESSFVIWDNE